MPPSDPYTVKVFVEDQEEEVLALNAPSAAMAYALAQRLLADDRIEEVTIVRKAVGLYITLAVHATQDLDDVLRILKVG